MKKIVIIGGVAGGASAAARIRRLDESARIVMLEKGEYVSFANCGLPYYVGGAITDRAKLTLQTPESFRARFNVDTRVKTEAVGIDRARRVVTARETDTGRTYEESYDALLIATGASPVVPPIPGRDNPGVFTLRSIPDALAMRAHVEGLLMKGGDKSCVVIGGGYIGVEMAENLRAAGMDVLIVEAADHLIAPLDADAAADLQNYIVSQGVGLRLGAGVTAIDRENGRLRVRTGEEDIPADMVVMAVGVRPDTRLAREAGLRCNPRGGILTDDHMRTDDPFIYAAGDAVEVEDFVTRGKAMIPLAGPANKQGRVAADNICGLDSTYTGTQGSSVLKVFDMAVAMTGINERQAKASGIDYFKTYHSVGNHAAYYPGAVNMSIKALFEKKSGRLLGAQIAGFDGVDKRCDVLATALRFGATCFDLTRLELCYAPPFGSAKDPVNMVGYTAENVMRGLVRQAYWDDLPRIRQDGNAQLLDVRESAEVARGAIDGFAHIPLGALRERLNELDPSKPVYVHCQSGLRSYIACRILTGHGFACYNLAGGYRLYDALSKARGTRL